MGSIDRIGGNLNARTLMHMLISPGISVAATRACNRYAGHLQSILASPFVEPCRNPTKGIERRLQIGFSKTKAHAFKWFIKSPAGAQRSLLFSSAGVDGRINLRNGASISPLNSLGLVARSRFELLPANMHQMQNAVRGSRRCSPFLSFLNKSLGLCPSREIRVRR